MKKLFSYVLLAPGVGRARADKRQRSPERIFLSFLLLLVSGIFCFSHVAVAQARYTAGDINGAATKFYSRFDDSLVNIDFIVSSAKNSADYRVDKALEDVGVDQSTAGSVVVEPGADIGNAVIVNINNGDNVAIGNN